MRGAGQDTEVTDTEVMVMDTGPTTRIAAILHRIMPTATLTATIGLDRTLGFASARSGLAFGNQSAS